MPLNVYTSNRMERLVEKLGDLLERPLASPFTPETIVVQSKGMQRWLSMELARRFGVWAGGEYPFPNKFTGELFRAAIPDLPEGKTFDPAVMTWRIMELLPTLLGDPAFVGLRGYLAGGERELKLYQLSGKIADTFDQYTLFRPRMLAGWEAGGEEEWQAPLWRALTIGEGQHRGKVREEFLRRLKSRQVEPAAFPERVTVFGISYLPAFHLEVLAALAPFIEVNLFVLSPCREYWGDIVPLKAQLRRSPAEREQMVEGHPLLASLGRLGRDFSSTILDCSEVSGGEQDLYGEAPGSSLLATIQNSILDLEEAGGTPEKLPVAADDRSIRIHSCHSPMREVEVLYDNLLAMFADDSTLTPRDILVMTPDIETYAPYIAAVFDGSQDQRKRIPFSIADRSIRREGGLAEALLAILELPGHRFPVTRVMDILVADPVRARFGLEDADLEQVRQWLEETRVRWGMDEEERQRAGFPPYRENSWRAGLDRLLLGYALPDEGGQLYRDILPFDSMEGDGPALLGRFASFVEGLYRLTEGLDRPRTLAEWEETLRGMIREFFAPDDEAAFELATVTNILDELKTIRADAGFSGKVGLPVIRAWLAGRLDREVRGLGFMTGGVTFCAMLPMRSIPFRVIALLGMNDDAFPRQSRAPGFDLIARKWQPGDRSLRDEDRYLFLEALLSARQRLYLSYTGQSIRDNSSRPPSVLVDELLDYLGRRFTDGSREFPASLVVRHHLQPFSPAYFTGDGELFSFSEEDCRAMEQRLAGTKPAPLFIPAPLPEPPEELRTVSLANLLSFYDNPARYLLRTRLGIRLDETTPPLDDREPFALDPLDGYGLRREMLELALAGGDPLALLPVARARGLLPPARQGEILFNRVAGEVAEMAERVRLLTSGQPPLDPLEVELAIGPFRLTGAIGQLWPDQLLRSRCAKLSGRDQVRLWIEHLVLNCLEREGYPAASALVTSDGLFRLAPVEGCHPLLERLLERYWEGLQSPLHFFPKSAAAYAKKWDISSARTAWSGERFPESGDPSYQLCFGGSDPLDEEFEELAREVFAPLVAAQF